MIIKESAENYLEAILMIKNKKGYNSVGVKDFKVFHSNFCEMMISKIITSFLLDCI